MPPLYFWLFGCWCGLLRLLNFGLSFLSTFSHFRSRCDQFESSIVFCSLFSWAFQRRTLLLIINAFSICAYICSQPVKLCRDNRLGDHFWAHGSQNYIDACHTVYISVKVGSNMREYRGIWNKLFYAAEGRLPNFCPSPCYCPVLIGGGVASVLIGNCWDSCSFLFGWCVNIYDELKVFHIWFYTHFGENISRRLECCFTNCQLVSLQFNSISDKQLQGRARLSLC